MSKIVSKFGGTSMASAENISKVISIVKADSEHNFVVVSAPGKKFKQDIKITDVLFECAVQVKMLGDCPMFDLVEANFRDIVSGLKLDFDIDTLLQETKRQIIEQNSVDFAASRGEFLAAKILAHALNYNFVDASELIKFDEKGVLMAEETNRIASKVLSKYENAVIPGFYGINTKGKIQTFSRGGSDITGSIVSRALDASLYENWTDVNGFLTADPGVIDSPRQIFSLSYKELRELSYMGASVLHTEAVFPVAASNIPINIKNTFNPSNPGTLILPTITDNQSNPNAITGISGKKDYTALHIEKDLLSNEVGLARKVLEIFQNNNISVEHIPSGIDSAAFVFSSNQLTPKTLDRVVRELQISIAPDVVEVSDKLALIAVVGRNIKANSHVFAKIFNALERENIQVRLINLGSRSLNITVGVSNFDFDTAIKAIYEELIVAES